MGPAWNKISFYSGKHYFEKQKFELYIENCSIHNQVLTIYT
jgi:hypothetical protein